MSELETTIEELRRAVDGDVCSRSRVVDGLLDLRLEAEEHSELLTLVDAALAGVPGRNLVPAAWWLEQLAAFELAVMARVETGV